MSFECIVNSVRGTSLPLITGVGYLSPMDELIAHPDETIRYSDATGGLESFLFLNLSRQYWAFFFHDACWSLLLSRTSQQGHESAQVVRHLFQILYCTPWKIYYTAMRGHDYGGASNFHRGSQLPGYSIPLPLEWSFLSADPREYLSTNSQDSGSLFVQTTLPTLQFDQLNSTDIFCMLPDEVVELILNNLTSKDVCNLRQSSKRVAGISSFQTLPQSFWASRFEEEHEMGFALAYKAPSRLERHADWRNLYVAFKNSLKSLNEGWGVKNRRRIWHVLKNISDPIIHLINNDPDQQKEDLDNNRHLGSFTCSPVVSAEIMSEDQAQDVLQIGSRRLVVNHLQWPQSGSPGEMRIGVSFTPFNGRSYVSGLRIWRPDYSHDSSESQRLGLIVPSTEKVVSFDPHHLDGFEIALTISGIIGLRFLTKRVSGELAYTTGDFATTTPDVGVARLLRHHENQISAVQMGFDV